MVLKAIWDSIHNFCDVFSLLSLSHLTFTAQNILKEFLSVCNNHFKKDNIIFKKVMDKYPGKSSLNVDDLNVTVPPKESSKCSLCNFAPSQAHNLRAHMKRHTGEKSNKCNQCEYASSYASALKAHLKMHSGEKPNKCNLCDYASAHASNLRTHLKTHSGKSQTNATNANMHALLQAI